MGDINFLHQSFEGSSGYLPEVMIVEDDRILSSTLAQYLKKTRGIECQVFNNAKDLLSSLEDVESTKPFLLIVDISLEGGMDGLTLIDLLKEKNFTFETLVMTGFGSIESAISATKKGVFHYLTKPFELDVLGNLVEKAFVGRMGVEISKIQKQEAKNIVTESSSTPFFKLEKPAEEDIFQGIIGRSKAMKDVFERVRKVAKSDSTVLISGASGTGKELIAHAIHSLSDRNAQPQVSVNCGAIPGDLLESELFGHEKGAFTGAISSRKGRFQMAEKGTIFLDEIGDMPALLQVKILRALQAKTIETVGGGESIPVNVRVITATHRDLEKMVLEGTFREDLFYRLNVIPIKLPALKERREDIPLLISHFLEKFVSADGRNSLNFSNDALELIMSYDWPGNVRELENLVERLVILRGGNTIRPEDLPAKIYRNNPLAVNFYQKIFELPDEGVNLKSILSEIEDSLILQALERTEGNKNQASKLLNLNRTTLIEKMKKKSIEFRAT